jgi:hypothetical protein
MLGFGHETIRVRRILSGTICIVDEKSRLNSKPPSVARIGGELHAAAQADAGGDPIHLGEEPQLPPRTVSI